LKVFSTLFVHPVNRFYRRKAMLRDPKR